MDRLSRLALLGSFAVTLVSALVHAACTTAVAVDQGTGEAVSGRGADGYGYGYDDYGAGASVADDSAR